MRRSNQASLGTSLALVLAIAAVAAIAAVMLVPRADTGRTAQIARAGNNTVYIVLPPPTVAAAPPPASETGASIATAEPFEPPAPAMIATASPPAAPSPPLPAKPSTVAAAAPAASSPGVQVAALTPPEPSADPTPFSVPPPLRAIQHENRAVHAVPPRGDTNPSTGRASPKSVAALPERRGSGAGGDTGARDDLGVEIDGPAIVTGALELNVAGKPLRLYGVKAPGAGDMCAPNAEYAARSCPDVSRDALAAHIGPKGKVSCRILASGGREALPAVCKDSTGADLASYLVAHGFALAEANDMMIDYSAAETQAKTAHTGLWSNR
jgi:endonuclease YncB( thermonuclease family)